MGMISTVVIAGVLFATAASIIYKKIKNVGACDCSSCSKVSCSSFKSLEQMNDLNLLDKN